VLIGLVVVGYAASLTDGYTRRLILYEDGLIEGISAIGYFICLLFMSRHGGQEFLKRYRYAVIVLSLMGLREHDLHKVVFFEGIFSTQFYIDPGAPVLYKLFGAVVIILVLYPVCQVVAQLSGPFVRGLRRLDRCAVAMAGALGLLVMALVTDGIGRKLVNFNALITEQTEKTLGVFEEVGEMGIPIMILLGLYYYFEDNARSIS
jgi:hypothetical protein